MIDKDIDRITRQLGPFKNMKIPTMKAPDPLTPMLDKRSRSERREDFERKLKELDKPTLIQLLDDIKDVSNYEDLWDYKSDLQNTVSKLIRYMNEFDDLNSDESRKIALKEQELKLESKHDWAGKFRLFFFRILATVLFVISLFTIGYIEHNYDWAKLPLSKYIKTTPVK